MNKSLHIFILGIWSLIPINAHSQCTPESCPDSLPPFGGICDKAILAGMVNQYYYDFTSFQLTDLCMDAGILDSLFKDIGAKMLKLHSVKFSGLPGGLTGSTNKTEYSAPANGCASISGIPAEAGLFKVAMHMLVNIRTWPISNTCSGFLSLDLNNQSFDGSFSLIIAPDAGFSGLDSVYSIHDPPVTLTPTGNRGGNFSGPGVTGNTFNPSLAGTGTHQIKYEVSVQQGAAVEPATGNSVCTVTVTGSSDSDIYEMTGDRFRIYPNPAVDRIIIESSRMPDDAVIIIYSVQGLVISTTPVQEMRMKVDVADLASGVYFVMFTDNKNSVVKKFVRE